YGSHRDTRPFPTRRSSDLTLMQPASNAKLFTTAAALAIAGPDYRFQTTVESSLPVDRDGRVAGDLSLVGRGDPNLSSRVLPFSGDRKSTRLISSHASTSYA